MYIPMIRKEQDIMVILAVIGSIALLFVGVFGLNKAWEIQRIWLRHPALLAGTLWVTVALYWLFTSLMIANGTLETDHPAMWAPTFIIALFWLYITFIIDRRDRAKRDALNR